jgi:prephenate dehydratase
MRVAIQGEAGSFHHQVAKQWFGNDVSIVPGETFGEVFATLARFEADMVVTAVENSLYGSINEVLDLLESYQFAVVGEVFLRVGQQLIGLPGADLKNITKIYSHPVALAQCEQFLESNLPHAERIEHHDTAASVEFVKKLGDSHAAAIAGETAATLHGLPVLARDIEDNKANYTRFLVLSPRAERVTGANKASLVITTDHAPGALGRVLAAFAGRGANLTKLQSRPIIGEPWKYRFYLDVETSPQILADTLAEIKKEGVETTVLGTYVAATL